VRRDRETLSGINQGYRQCSQYSAIGRTPDEENDLAAARQAGYKKQVEEVEAVFAGKFIG
jgi:hypothetical protein